VNALEINGIDVKMSPLSVGIAEVVLDKLSARAVIGADGKANVAELMVEQPAPASAPAPASSSAQTSSPTPASAAATAPPPVRVGKIIFRDCDFGFLDRSLKPSYSITIGSVSGLISGFALDGSQTGTVDIKARLTTARPSSSRVRSSRSRMTSW